MGAIVLPFERVLLENLVEVDGGGLLSTTRIRTLNARIEQILLGSDFLKTKHGAFFVDV